MSEQIDVVVIGGGHAGAEAARIAARGGCRVALVTLIRDAIGRMSCNPAIGGLAKGHLVKEIDALGGLMAEATDAAGIQFKILNRSKGPAVQGPRAQCDRDLYASAVQHLLSEESHISVIESSVSQIETDHQQIVGVRLSDGSRLRCRAVIVTTGTFLRALMHSGEQIQVGGRFGEPSSDSLSSSLASLGLRLGRLKTGTPPRILRESVDFTKMEPQPGDALPRPFSILTDSIQRPQILCYLTYTSEKGHDLIRANLHRAPMYSGQISATGPRYCPSIEDKVVRFADKDRHQIFVEPEGLNHPWLYLNGISTSLPADVQDGLVHSIDGMERAVIARYGYAVEYDFVNPEQLDPTLQARDVAGLFLAGQINGTSGYEEAAAQGLIAGLNALQYVRGGDPVILGRQQAYLGVMIDDLITLGTEEPYRMFTSRAEHRLLLGCDSVYERLSPLAEALGVLDEPRKRRIEQRAARLQTAREEIAETMVSPRETADADLMSSLGIMLDEKVSLTRLFQRNDFQVGDFLIGSESRGVFSSLRLVMKGLTEEERDSLVNRVRYAGYVEKQMREAERTLGDQELGIPASFDYQRPGFSREVIEKLSFVRPRTVGQASRIRGMTPAATSILRMHVRNLRRNDDRRREAGKVQESAPHLDR